MKRSALYVVLLLILVLVVAVLCIRVFTAPTEPRPTQAPTKEELTLPPVDTEPTENVTPPVADETPIPTPEETPEQTEMPFETREPLESEEPVEPEETLPPLAANGTFRSATGTGLNLVADWVASDGNDGGALLQVTVSAESYSFFTSALYQSLTLTVNGETYSANTPEIAYEGGELALTPLAQFTVEVPRAALDMRIVWHYKGSYSGVELSEITAGTLVNLG